MMTASAFRADCLAASRWVQRQRGTIIITKRGKPMAKLVPVGDEKDE